MRILPLAPEELEAALRGEGQGPAAESWRELRTDVRESVGRIDPAFEARLRERLREPADSSAGRRPAWRRLFRPGLPYGRPLAIGGAFALAALLVAVAIFGSGSSGSGGRTVLGAPEIGHLHETKAASKADKLGPASPSVATNGAAESGSSAAAAGPATAGGRLQQLGASITLAGSPGEVQSIADGVSRLTTVEGGFVQSSQVDVQKVGGSEATLQLSIPSSHLSRALAALARLAPVRAENQSLQDITGSYDRAKRALSNAEGERRALLRALAQASTQGAIESLRQRIAEADRAIEQAQGSVRSIARTAENSTVEVSVVSSATAGGGGLTLHRGLHDAARVLTVALIVLLIALAGLVPLLLALGAILAGTRVWRRTARERALRSS